MIRFIDKLKCKIADDSHLIELLQGTSTAFIYRIIGLILGYVFTIIISRAYGAEAMGIYALSLAVLGIAALIGKLGTDTALLRFIPELTSQNKSGEIWSLYKKVLIYIIPFAFVVSFCTYLSAPFIANHIFGKLDLTEYFQIASLAVVPFVFLSINREAIRGSKRVQEYSFLANILVVFLAIIFLLSFYFYSDGIGVPILAQVFAIYISSVISFMFWYKIAPKNFDKRYSNNSIKNNSFLSVSIPMLITSSMTMIIGLTDIIMLGIFINESVVGIYNVAQKISIITSIALVAINTIAAPKFAELWGANDMKGLSRLIRQSSKLVFWVSFPILVIFICFPSWVLSFFGNEFVAGSVILIILAFGQFINSACGSVGIIMNMTNNHKTLQYSVMFSAVINVFLNLILIPEYGALGAAISTTISLVLWNIFCVYYIKMKLNILTCYIPFLKMIKVKHG